MWSRAPPAPPRGMLLLALLALAALVLADRPRRAEMSPVPFVMGSRYGRSPERVMAPRNDRFFMGSRYGKRSQPASGEVWEGCEGGACRLLCVPLRATREPQWIAHEPQWTAHEPQRAAAQPQLYKCVRAPTRNHHSSRSLSDVVGVRAGEGDE